MGVKYVKDFEFSKGAGFSGSGKSMKKEMGGGVRRPLSRMTREERKAMPVRRMMEEAAQRRQMADRPVEAEPMMRRPVAPMRGAMMKKGGKVTGEKAQKKVGKVMREFKEGKLHSGKDGPVVKNPKQAMAIALSEARSMKKADGGEVSKGPKTRGTARKGREQGRKQAMERWANQRMRHAEKYAPGMDLDNIHDAEIKEASKKADRYQQGGIARKRPPEMGRVVDPVAPEVVRRKPSSAMQDRLAAIRAGQAERRARNQARLDSVRAARERFAARKAGMAMKKGGEVHSDVKMDKAMMKKAVHKHEKAMHPGKPLTKLKRGGLPVHQGSPMYGKK